MKEQPLSELLDNWLKEAREQGILLGGLREDKLKEIFKQAIQKTLKELKEIKKDKCPAYDYISFDTLNLIIDTTFKQNFGESLL